MVHRLLKTIFDHRWRFIFAEFILIVAGIFLGLQADSWFENRRLAESLDIYVVRLKEDIDQMILDLGEGYQMNMQQRDAAIRTLRAVEHCAVPETQVTEFEQVLADHQVLLGFNITRSTYNEMIAVGAFAHIENIQLKDTLSRFYAVANSSLGFTDYFRSDLGRSSDIIWRYVKFSTDDAGEPLVAGYDMEAMCNSVEMKNALVEVVDARKDWMWIAGGMLEMLRDLSRLLEEEIGPPVTT
jgi:hypothetical protein